MRAGRANSIGRARRAKPQAFTGRSNRWLERTDPVIRVPNVAPPDKQDRDERDVRAGNFEERRRVSGDSDQSRSDCGVAKHDKSPRHVGARSPFLHLPQADRRCQRSGSIRDCNGR
jgi:hypothetical protein